MNVIFQIVPTSYLETSNPESLLSLFQQAFSLPYHPAIQKEKQPFDENPGAGWIAGLLAVSLSVLCECWVTSDGASVPRRRAERENVRGFLRSQSVRVYGALEII